MLSGRFCMCCAMCSSMNFGSCIDLDVCLQAVCPCRVGRKRLRSVVEESATVPLYGRCLVVQRACAVWTTRWVLHGGGHTEVSRWVDQYRTPTQTRWMHSILGRRCTNHESTVLVGLRGCGVGLLCCGLPPDHLLYLGLPPLDPSLPEWAFTCSRTENRFDTA